MMLKSKTNKKNRFNSFNYGRLSEGCKLCVKGRKSVLFITGVCPRQCFYCPISEKKKDKDVIYINELKTEMFEKIIEEIKLCSSKGVGITGGDPLARLNRTCNFIEKLKKEFGKKFHIHLYTSLNLVNEGFLDKLYFSGLDEIRFHPDLYNSNLWYRIKLFSKYNWKVGMEIPIIPSMFDRTKKLIGFVSSYVDFINLNELEYSDNVSFEGRNLYVKDELSYAIKGSLEDGLKLMDYCKIKRIRCHVCTAKLKDSVQLANRMKLRLKKVKLWCDKKIAKNILERYAIYIEKPGKYYQNRIKKISFQQLENLQKELKFKSVIDVKKRRLLTSKRRLKKNLLKIKNKNLFPIIVKEYPTSDQFELELEFL